MTETHQNFKRGAIVFLPPRFPSPGMPRVPPQVGEIRCDAPLATNHRPPLPQPGEEVLVDVDIEGRKRWLNGTVVVPNTELSDDEFQVLVDGDHGWMQTYSSRMEGDEWLRPDCCSHRTLLVETLKVPTLNTRSKCRTAPVATGHASGLHRLAAKGNGSRSATN